MPHVIVIAGANGAGKSTVAPFLLRDKLGISEFVNADTLAQGLSAFAPEKAAITAGKIMLSRLNELAGAGKDFAFETTLSTRSFVPRLKKMRENGYKF
ncbi:MAG TPA: zeta toxin family protein, partial [Pyrinomonadaceae bacterium]|nr:zeta toxin family protein [Pyrinomonadaceae bacterium]